MGDIWILIGYRLMYGEDRNEGDKMKIEEWLEASEENRQIYKRLADQQNWKEWVDVRETIHSGEYWKVVECQTIRHSALQLRRRLLFIASCLILLLSVGLVFFFGQGTSKVQPQQVAGILPGISRAQLVFADGKRMMLDSRTSPDRQIKIDGTTIQTDSAGISYMADEKEADAESRHTLLVPKGGEYMLTLEDGTKVHLNSRSILEFPVHFRGEKREVYLEGEAFFRVKHTDSLPFIVHTRKMDVLVTGTEFNVKSYPDEAKIQTTLVKGQVKVTTGQTTYELLPEQQAELDLQTMKTIVREVDTEEYVAWKNGWFIFKGQRLEEIMNELSRWYDFEVFYQNPGVKDMIFGGKLDRSGSIEPILKIMEATLTVDVSIKGKTIVFHSK